MRGANVLQENERAVSETEQHGGTLANVQDPRKRRHDRTRGFSPLYFYFTRSYRLVRRVQKSMSSVVTNTWDQPKTMQNQSLQALFYSERYISILNVLTRPKFLRM